jgi:hypothetical protein
MGDAPSEADGTVQVPQNGSSSEDIRQTMRGSKRKGSKVVAALPDPHCREGQHIQLTQTGN